MSRTNKSPLLSVALDRKAGRSLQVQVYEQVRDAILSGRLKPGTALPASRIFAEELGISRNTILGAFDRLYSEGYIEGRAGSATRVSDVLPEEILNARSDILKPIDIKKSAGKVSGLALDLSKNAGTRRFDLANARAFRPGLPDLEHFPFREWSRMVAKFWRNPPQASLLSGDLLGYMPLRQSIAAYLNAVRGLNCEAEQIMITSGAQQALDLISRALVDPGDPVWVEDPAYGGLLSCLRSAGAQVNPIPIDAEGISVTAGQLISPDATLAAVTPSRQFPIGLTMSLSRRLELLAWAEGAGAWILEDDYDSEFRYRGHPLSALQGLDESGRVIYIGSFSKVMFPALRLGYMVLPAPLIPILRDLRGAIDDYPALALQPALHTFFEDGHFAAHIRRLRNLYAQRQECLLEQLSKMLTGALTAKAHEAGMHIIGRIDASCPLKDFEVAGQARDAGLITPALSSFYSGKVEEEGLILGYAGLREIEIVAGVRKLVPVFEA